MQPIIVIHLGLLMRNIITVDSVPTALVVDTPTVVTEMHDNLRAKSKLRALTHYTIALSISTAYI